jgi:hypothetical protein
VRAPSDLGRARARSAHGGPRARIYAGDVPVPRRLGRPGDLLLPHGGARSRDRSKHPVYAFGAVLLRSGSSRSGSSNEGTGQFGPSRSPRRCAGESAGQHRRRHDRSSCSGEDLRDLARRQPATPASPDDPHPPRQAVLPDLSRRRSRLRTAVRGARRPVAPSAERLTGLSSGTEGIRAS